MKPQGMLERWRAAAVLALMGCAAAAHAAPPETPAAPPSANAVAAQPTPCAAAAWSRAPDSIGRLVLLGSAELPRLPGSHSAAFGGISGIDFDPDSGWWYLLSDDRSVHAPARYYPARITLGERGIGRITLEAPVALPLPPGEVPDPEALRVLPCRALLAWASEGDRTTGLQPAVRLITPEGRPAGDIGLPATLLFQPGRERGARHNRTLEGLAYSPAGDALWLAMEGPLYEDGPLPDLQRGALLRFTRLPLNGGAPAQLAYPVDAIPAAATGGASRADNGVSEILGFAADRLLVVERSGREVAAGQFVFDIRLYETWPGEATHVADLPSLAGADLRPMPKRLLLALSTLGLPHVDNIEAAAWGPRLADGRATLLLVSDDNFSPSQVNQFLLFAVEPQ